MVCSERRGVLHEMNNKSVTTLLPMLSRSLQLEVFGGPGFRPLAVHGGRGIVGLHHILPCPCWVIHDPLPRSKGRAEPSAITFRGDVSGASFVSFVSLAVKAIFLVLDDVSQGVDYGHESAHSLLT